MATVHDPVLHADQPLDTNLVLSALVFAGGRLAALRAAWQSGRCVPLVSQATASELIRVLASPKFTLTAADREELLADYLPYCRSVPIPARLPKLPQCRDANDQMFIELAAAGKADFLLTGDKDLLVLAPEFGRRIVTAEAYLDHLGAT
ncbi:MAG TPA: putative toxin-antitoxin system toxin component, PIN family [Burkholderiaceae bacterium]